MSVSESPLTGRMIFNVGARRSGTYWLQRIVSSHPSVAAIPSETHLISHGVAPLIERLHQSAKSSPQVGVVYADRGVVIDHIRSLCDAIFGEFLEPGQSHLAERTPFHVLHLPLLYEIYPDARVVHIIRDGRDVARSIGAQWWGPETIEEAAREWTESVRAGRAAGATADRYRELRYEDLLRQPEIEVPALFAWLGIELTDANLAEALAEARRTRNVDKTTPADVGEGKWRTGLSAEEQRAVAAVAGDLLAELGYDAEPATTRARARVRKPTRAGLSRSRGRSPAELGRLAGRRQRLVDEVVTAIHSGDAEALDRLLLSEVKITLVFAQTREQLTGEPGRRRLLELAAEWRGRGERQVSGSVYPSNPSTAALLRYELPDGSTITRALIVSQEKAGVTEITLHDAL